MNENPLTKLESFGQSIWMDFIRRGVISSGELEQYIQQDGVSGVTSNPSIFEKAISGSRDYDAAIRSLALAGKDVNEIYLGLVIDDIRQAADLFRPVYDRADGQDGFVSLEVSPYLAHDTPGTTAEARRLWSLVARPNVMIKVPGTLEGLPAIQQLISEGININITLLFGLPRYQSVAEAYLAGLETRLNQGKPVDRVASVASFFLSRIDTLLDPQLEEKAKSSEFAGLATTAHGQTAIASAKLAYQLYKEIFNSPRFQKLSAQHARVQRLLWASTSTKNPAYSDVKYVEPLIGPDTINTLPFETIQLYRDHGNPALRLEEEVKQARQVFDSLPRLGIDIDKITQNLEDDGVKKFIKAYDLLIETLQSRQKTALAALIDSQTLSLNSYTRSVNERVASLDQNQFMARLWRKDASLWKTDPDAQASIRNALGWLHVAEKMEENLNDLHHFVEEVKAAGIRRVVHLGMGGSSLAPLVLKQTFPPVQGGLDLTILDSTDPTTVGKVDRANPPAETLYIVASKSGTTTEPLVFADYFYNRVKEVKGNRAGENFVAITDPGTPLVEEAQQRGFRRVFLNFPDIGGRFSALTYFGLVPAALYGLDVNELLARALRMQHACVSAVPTAENPGLMLGAVLGELSRLGRDKVTILTPAPLASLGMWLEQLLAESTGKEGTGLLPVSGEPPGPLSIYGQDRLFVYFQLADSPDEALERSVRALQSAGQPVVTIRLEDRMDLGQEFMRWEVATAVAGAVLGINAFDQPNVQESKDNTQRLLDYYRQRHQLPEEAPSLQTDLLSAWTSEPDSTVEMTLNKFMMRARPGDFVALLAYLSEDPAVDQALLPIRLKIRDHLHLATTLGYGPRYLHSTGQYHKGGANTGLFILITASSQNDVPVPEKAYSFNVLNRAQALGDFETLRQHKRRVMRIDLGKDIRQGLSALNNAIETALSR